ncbi:MAG: histidinol dehydrogenase [Armatimonadota bacterium]|jgi:histidinol dehydrogenase
MATMRTINLIGISVAELDERLPPRARPDMADAEAAARDIIAAVRDRGDEAVLEYERTFDCPTLELDQLRASVEEIQSAYEAVPAQWLKAVRRAIENIEAYHKRQLRRSWHEPFGDIVLGEHIVPLASVGVYAPMARAPLPSSILMSAIPARVAGVERIVLCTPPRRDGRVEPVLLVAAAEANVREVYKVGGAVAVAAMACGTASIPKVDKIVGPGNEYMVAAKRLVFGEVGIESLPGPSETCVIADATANPAYVAADLLSQAEHGEDSPAFLITPSEELAARVAEELEAQLASLPRSDYARASLEDCGAIILTADLAQAAEVANHLAPEHLQIIVRDPEALLAKIRNAGCIFLGEYSPVALGDYIAGPSHVLPTNRTARFSSPLSVYDFLKHSSIIHASAAGLGELADATIALAEAEGLTAHARSIEVRRGAARAESGEGE